MTQKFCSFIDVMNASFCYLEVLVIFLHTSVPPESEKRPIIPDLSIFDIREQLFADILALQIGGNEAHIFCILSYENPMGESHLFIQP